jgi:hypothetical protein
VFIYHHVISPAFISPIEIQFKEADRIIVEKSLMSFRSKAVPYDHDFSGFTSNFLQRLSQDF